MLPSWLNAYMPSIDVVFSNQAQVRQQWCGMTMQTWTRDIDSHLRGLEKLVLMVDQLLVDRPAQKRSLIAPINLSILIPDQFARFEMLPWTPSLMRQSELHQFAIERFELHHQPVRSGWEVQADWCTKGANTLAYALPHDLIQKLENVVQKNAYQLQSVLPISALAHYGQLGFSRGSHLRIIRSDASVSVLLYIKGGLHLYAMEAVRGYIEDTIQRLMSRVQMSINLTELNLKHISLCGIESDLIRHCLPELPNVSLRIINPLRRTNWL